MCSIDDKGDKFKGDCQNYLTFFKEERCPFDLPKCESRVCRSFGCSGGQLACNDECIDPQRDIRYCGAQTDCLGDNAGTKCASGQVCNQGKCQITCVDSQIVCAGKCVDPQNDVVYCGAKSDCLGDNSGTKCVSGQVCSEGTCGVSCVVGQVICDNKCVDPSNDGRYCGADEDCADAKECASGEVCSQGVCAVSCVDGQIVCGNKCVDSQTDNAYCGALEIVYKKMQVLDVKMVMYAAMVGVQKLVLVMICSVTVNALYRVPILYIVAHLVTVKATKRVKDV